MNTSAEFSWGGVTTVACFVVRDHNAQALAYSGLEVDPYLANLMGCWTADQSAGRCGLYTSSAISQMSP